ncbi:YciI family protein [uncultured Cellulomonas sp.]|uniref:YciI family protein n=1 Tax=uncultured Cellulomonas sp. TaxID=189682 RepID=UPI0028EC8BB0|nr:YciI family protein [uncultured Cellulomonas sp.]
MLLMNYFVEGVPPIDQWAPEDVRRHIQFQHDLGAELVASGELVDGQGLAWPDTAKFVTSDGVSAPVITDGPFPESKEFLAGYWMVDVEDEARAVAIAAQASAAPGPGGAPMQQVFEVRALMEAPAPAE